jgi:hypothetical protein
MIQPLKVLGVNQGYCTDDWNEGAVFAIFPIVSLALARLDGKKVKF